MSDPANNPAHPRPDPRLDQASRPDTGPRPDPRAERTRESLRQALLAECAARPLPEVTVASVVRRAGTARATFYLHYPDIDALAVDACLATARDAVEALHAWRGIPDPNHPPPPLTDFFARLAEDGGLTRSVLTPHATGPFGDVLRRELHERSRTERDLVGAPHADVVAAAVSGAFASLLADWLHAEEPARPEEISGRAWRLLIALHRAV
jgi:AcrR family transcriptional regulator